MKKTATIALICLAGFVNVCSTVLFYQEAGRVVKENLYNARSTTYTFATSNISTNLTYNGLIEKVSETIDMVFKMPKTSKVSTSCGCATRI